MVAGEMRNKDGLREGFYVGTRQVNLASREGGGGGHNGCSESVRRVVVM